MPPPSTFVGAVGSGPVDEGLLLLEAELFWVLLPDCVAVGVIVTTTADVNVDSTRPEPSVIPVVSDVERINEADDDVEFEEPPEGEAEAEFVAADDDDELC